MWPIPAQIYTGHMERPFVREADRPGGSAEDEAARLKRGAAAAELDRLTSNRVRAPGRQ